MGASELVKEIEQRRADALERRTTQYPRSNPIASDLGPCTREMVLAITRWADRPLPPSDLKARFERGNLIEDTVMRELSALGIYVRTERTPFEVKNPAGQVILRGKVDGFIEWGHQVYPVEVKSLDPNVFRRVETVQDFSRWPWAAKYPRQICAYLYANNLEEGLFLLDDCLGHWKLIPVPLDYEAMEAILRQCETAVSHVQAHTLPDYHKDAAICRRCWAFGRVCDPPVEHQGIQLLADPDFEAKLDRRGELEPGAEEYDALDKEIKARIKGKDGLVVGQWLIQGKEVVKLMKAKAAYEQRYWLPKIMKIEADKEGTSA